MFTYQEESNIGAILAAMPAEACGLPVTTLVVVDGGDDGTDRVSWARGRVRLPPGGEPRPRLRAPGSATRSP